jgi:hypothetical protein
MFVVRGRASAAVDSRGPLVDSGLIAVLLITRVSMVGLDGPPQRAFSDSMALVPAISTLSTIGS